MSEYIKGFIKKEMIKRDFKSTEEAISFLISWVNKWTEALQELYKNEKEASVKEHLIIKKVSELICDKLEIYGMKISYEDMEKEARAEIDKNWPRIKKEVAETLEARNKAIDDLLKGT